MKYNENTACHYVEIVVDREITGTSRPLGRGVATPIFLLQRIIHLTLGVFKNKALPITMTEITLVSVPYLFVATQM